VIGYEFICAQLALKAWQDGANSGISGMLGVAFTIRNRIRAGWYDGNWIEILSHHREWAATDTPYSDVLPDPRDFSFKVILQEVGGIFSGARQDDVTIKVGGEAQRLSVAPPPALYYGRIDEVDKWRPWFLENISRNVEKHRIVAQVGMLHFWS